MRAVRVSWVSKRHSVQVHNYLGGILFSILCFVSLLCGCVGVFLATWAEDSGLCQFYVRCVGDLL